MSTTNNITGDRITTASKPKSDKEWDALYERIRSTKNPRYWYEDADENGEGLYKNICVTCQTMFVGGKRRLACKFCVGG